MRDRDGDRNTGDALCRRLHFLFVAFFNMNKQKKRSSNKQKNEKKKSRDRGGAEQEGLNEFNAVT